MSSILDKRIPLVLAGAYVIVLESAAFDAFLILEDPAGKKLAENDDIDSGVNTNARLVFQAPKTAVYRLVATAFEQRGSGAYRLTIHEFDERTKPWQGSSRAAGRVGS